MHMGLRDFQTKPIIVQGVDFRREIEATRERVFAFARDIRAGAILGAGDKPFTDIVNIGIGGSDLGPAMAARALSPYRGAGPRIHFVANVDGADLSDHARAARSLAHAVHRLVESVHHAGDHGQRGQRAGARRRRAWRDGGAEALRRRVNAPRQGSGIRHQPERVFGFWDWVGGRYSLWSSIDLLWRSRSDPIISRNFCAAASTSTRIFARPAR